MKRLEPDKLEREYTALVFGMLGLGMIASAIVIALI